MKLKLTNDEATALLSELRDNQITSFSSEYEMKITGAVIRKFLTKLMKRMFENPDKLTMELDDVYIHALSYVIPRLSPSNSYNLAVISDLTLKLDSWQNT